MVWKTGTRKWESICGAGFWSVCHGYSCGIHDIKRTLFAVVDRVWNSRLRHGPTEHTGRHCAVHRRQKGRLWRTLDICGEHWISMVKIGYLGWTSDIYDEHQISMMNIRYLCWTLDIYGRHYISMLNISPNVLTATCNSDFAITLAVDPVNSITVSIILGRIRFVETGTFKLRFCCNNLMQRMVFMLLIVSPRRWL